MISTETLENAVRRGIISLDQRDQLTALETAPDVVGFEETQSDEPMRLVGGGNDLFVTVGIVLLVSGLLFALQSTVGANIPVIAAILGVFIWLVAEFVTRQHRMRLSSTVLGLGFIAAIATLLWQYIGGLFDFEAITNPLQIAAMRPQIGGYGGLFFGTVAIAAVIYFARFRVPIMAAVLALAFTGAAFLFTTLFLYDGVVAGQVMLPTAQHIPETIARALYVPLLCGFAVFATAVALDLRDRERFTVWSDCAFWLHVISAPLLVHPLFILATGQDVVFGEIEPGASASVMLGLLIAGFVYVALAIDRRSLLIPTLAYFGSLGIYYLVNSAANTTGIPPFALILLLVGGLIIMFGAGWQRIRRLIVATTLPTSLLSKLPPIKA
jgi:hypothetical protein